MRRIPFIHARFFDESQNDIEDRFQSFLKSWRSRRLVDGIGIDSRNPLSLDDFGDALLGGVELSYVDRARVKRRAERLHAARLASSGLGRLKPEEIRELSRLRDGVDLIAIESADTADLIASRLHAEFPWMAPATTALWHGLRRAAVGGQTITLPNMLLCGPPGIGKSAWARRLAELLELPACVIEIGSASSAFRIAGLERGWSSGMPGRPLETIIASRIGNPLIIVDEICKERTLKSAKGGVSSVSDALLALMERMTAREWECPFYRVGFDMAHVNWVLTANELERVSAPLRSRSTVVMLHAISKADLCAFARRQAREKGLSDESLDAILSVINHADHVRRRFNIRDVTRMLGRAAAMETRPVLH